MLERLGVQPKEIREDKLTSITEENGWDAKDVIEEVMMS